MAPNRTAHTSLSRLAIWLTPWFVPASVVIPAAATLVPNLDLPVLCESADLIAVGRIIATRQGGSATATTTSGFVPGRSMIADLRAEKVLKGQTPHTPLHFRFVLPEIAVGFRGVGTGQFGVFFFRRAEDGYQIFDPYHPFVAAVPGAPAGQGSCLDQVIAELGHASSSRRAPFDTRDEAVRELDTVRTPAATAVLQRVAGDPDLTLKARAIAALLRRNDTSFVSTAEEIIFSPDGTLHADLLDSLGYAIRDGLKDRRAIPALARLLRSGNLNVRRGSASALRSTADGAAIEPLTQALADSDPQVLYQAVIGLAELTGEIGEWAPAVDTFLKDPKRYVKHWRDWAESRTKK